MCLSLCLTFSTSQLNDIVVVVAKSMDFETSEVGLNHGYVIY